MGGSRSLSDPAADSSGATLDFIDLTVAGFSYNTANTRFDYDSTFNNFVVFGLLNGRVSAGGTDDFILAFRGSISPGFFASFSYNTSSTLGPGFSADSRIPPSNVVMEELPPPSAVPSITSVTPNPVTGFDQPQSFVVNGDNFLTGATVTLVDLETGDTFPRRPISFLNKMRIVIDPNFTAAPATWVVMVINPDGTSSSLVAFSVVELAITAPVTGKFRVTGRGNPNCSGQSGLWTYCQHQTGFHRAGGGIGGSDDTLAWDMNLLNDGDNKKPVYAVAPGTVIKYVGAHDPGVRSGAVLIRHITNGVTCWSGYLHMTDVRVKTNQMVTPATILGRISNVCDGCGGDSIPNHLHFVVYEGVNTPGGLVSRNVMFVERSVRFESVLPIVIDLLSEP